MGGGVKKKGGGGRAQDKKTGKSRSKSTRSESGDESWKH